MKSFISEASLERLIEANRDASERLDVLHWRPISLATKELVEINIVSEGVKSE